MAQLERLFGGVTMRPDPVFPLGTDTMALADFVRLGKRAQVCDLGAGSGALGLLLCGRDPACRVTGVELRPEACALASENIVDNRLQDRMDMVQGDLRQIRGLLPANTFNAVVSNPPYFKGGSGPVSQRAAEARTEETCTLEELCGTASWLLQSGGLFTLCYRPQRLCDLMCVLRANRLEPKRMRLVRHSPDLASALVLLEARLDGKPGLELGPDLILYQSDGSPAAEFKRIYHLEGDS